MAETVTLTIQLPKELLGAVVSLIDLIRDAAGSAVRSGDTSHPAFITTTGNESYFITSSSNESSTDAQNQSRPRDINEVREHCKLNGFSVDADRFFNYYNRRSWRDKFGTPVLDWREKLCEWEQRERERATGLQKDYNMIKDWANDTR